MTEKAQIKSVALFYFFSLLDEELAKLVTIRTLSKCRRRAEKDQVDIHNTTAFIVRVTDDMWLRYGRSKDKGHVNVPSNSNVILPNNINLGVWKEFRRDADKDEFLAVVWSQILNFDESSIAEGLNVSKGTVNHRVNRGLRLLGKLQK